MSVLRHVAPELTMEPTNSAYFLDTLGSMQEELIHNGVDYRIIGSVAAHAWLDDTEVSPAITPLNFNRHGAHTPDQAVPDIDLLLPRSDITFGQELRKKYQAGSHAVKLGLAVGVQTIDFCPNQSASRLTHGDIVQEFDSSTFAPHVATLKGVDVKTLSPDALLHTYVTAGGLLRKRDIPAVRGLSRLSYADTVQHTKEFGMFHDFIARRASEHPSVKAVGRTVEVAKNILPPRLYNFGYNQALKVASKLNLR